MGFALSSVGEVIVWTFSSQLLLNLTLVHLREHILSPDFYVQFEGVMGVAIPEVMIEQVDLGIMGIHIVLTGSLVVLAPLWGLWLSQVKFPIAPAGAPFDPKTPN